MMPFVERLPVRLGPASPCVNGPALSPTRPCPAARERQSAVERSIREEARRLRQGQGGGEAGGQGAAAAGRKNVDLESLSFAQGAHFNSSKQCTLPQARGPGWREAVTTAAWLV